MNTVHPQKTYGNFNQSPNMNNQFYSPSRNLNSPPGRGISPFYSPNKNNLGGRTSNFNTHQVPINGAHFSNSNCNTNYNNNFRDVEYKFNEQVGYKENQDRPMIFNDANGNYNQKNERRSNYLSPNGVMSPIYRPVVTEKERVERTLRSAQGVLTNRMDNGMNSLRDSRYMKKNFGVKASYHQK